MKEPLLDDNVFREVGNTIRTMRIARNWTQADLADRIFSDPRVVSRHENGGNMDLESFIRYTLAFHCDLSVLLPENLQNNQSSGIDRRISKLPPDKQKRMVSLIESLIDEVA